MGGMVQAELEVTNEHGLHLAPISHLVRLACQFDSKLTLSHGDRAADAKSVFDLMMLGATKGARLRLEAQGADADEAVRQVSELFLSGFAAAERSASANESPSSFMRER